MTCGEWAIASHGRLRVLFSVLNNQDNLHVLVIVQTGFYIFKFCVLICIQVTKTLELKSHSK
jgi:hypothetical protein